MYELKRLLMKLVSILGRRNFTMKSLKRMTASMLCAAMLISMLPTSAFALGEEETQEPPVEVSASVEPTAETSSEPSGEPTSAPADAETTSSVEPAEETPDTEPTPTPPDAEPTPTPADTEPAPDGEPTIEPTPVPTTSTSPEGGADIDLLGTGEDDGEIELLLASVKSWKLSIGEDGSVNGSVELTNVPISKDGTVYTLSFITETPKGIFDTNYFETNKKTTACTASSTLDPDGVSSGFMQYRWTVVRNGHLLRMI